MGEPCGGADEVAFGALRGRKLHFPVGSLFVDHHGEHLGHRVIDALDTAVGDWMVAASC